MSQTPVGTTGEINAMFNVSIGCAVNSDVKASLVPATNLVSQYNAENKTDYKALPENVAAALAVENATVEAGKTTATIRVTDGKADFSGLGNGTYLLPLTFAATYANGQTNADDADVAYLFVTVEENLIDDNPNKLIGAPADDFSKWTCVEADNFDPSSMTTNKWRPLAKKVISSFTIDFGDVHSVTGFMKPYSYIGCTDVDAYFSEDGDTWTYAGSTNGKKTVNAGSRKDYYVLVAKVKARYMKMDVHLSSDSYAWSYVNDSWATNYVGVDWNVVFDD